MKHYTGHPLQTRGAEQYVLQGGKGNGMHFLFVRNGLGLECWLSLDRAGDVSRLTFKGDNMGYFSPCGYVAPAFYDSVGGGFLKSFTAGFFTTCGLTAVGSPCMDEGEALPLHGTVSHLPAEVNGIHEDQEGLVVDLTIRDTVLFGRKLILRRRYTFSYRENIFTVSDTVTNQADTPTPYMIMYHCNMGYPLLSEQSDLRIPYKNIAPRNAHAAKYTHTAQQMEPPQANYEERCYYYDIDAPQNQATVGIYNNDIQKGVLLSYDKRALPCFTEWKLMGKTEYVLGLEPANCTADGRDIHRQNGTLQFLAPEEIATTALTFTFVEERALFEQEGSYETDHRV